MIYLDERLSDDFWDSYGETNAPHAFAILKGIAGEQLHRSGFDLNKLALHPTADVSGLQLTYLEHHCGTFYSDQPLAGGEVRQVYELIRAAIGDTDTTMQALIDAGLMTVDE